MKKNGSVLHTVSAVIPWLLTLIFAIWIVGSFRLPSIPQNAIDSQQFGNLPVISNGRFQPLDSLARNSLLQLREKQTALSNVGKGARQIAAIDWLMEMMMNPQVADTRPVFRIDNPQLKGLLALPMESDPEKQSDGKHYTWNQIKPKLEQLQSEAKRVGPLDQSHRTPFDQAVNRLWNGAILYMRLQNTIQPQNATNWGTELTGYLSNIPAGVSAARAQQEKKDFDKAALDKLVNDLSRFDAMESLEPPLVVPPQHPEKDKTAWTRMGASLMEIARGEEISPAVISFGKISAAYHAGAVSKFNEAVVEYQKVLGTSFSKELGKAKYEQVFNHFEPFYKAIIIYIVALLCAIAFWLIPQFDALRRCSFYLVFLAWMVHSSGLLCRMVLEGRPPVTNLYSSAIFIGWGAVALGMILERFWRNSIGVTVSSLVGFITLIIAHHLSLSGDTMEMMRAVLDTNLWLSTHVVVVTLGYASTYVAGFLAIIYIVLGVFTRVLAMNVNDLGAPSNSKLSPNIGKSLVKMVYGIVCFATLFSFVGTVLGGIWADQSWGRFWGWDPKENGALIIVLWNALILHARWGGMIRERGLINCALVGNIVTSWSWFGVNMLGIGLHSYGFMDAAFKWLMAFVGLQLVLIGLGLLPPRMWKSFSGTEEAIAPSESDEPPPLAPQPV